MAESREVRCYDYVTLPYERVRDVLRSDASTIFSRATANAADRARELIATLRLNVGPVEVGVDVRLQITGITDEVSATEEGALAETTWFNTSEVLPAKSPLPLKTAVIGWVPVAANVKLNCAPPLNTIADPTWVAPSINVTLPHDW